MTADNESLGVRSLTDSLEIERALLRAAFDQMPLNMTFTVMTALLCTSIWWNIFPRPVLLMWSGALLLVNVVSRYWLWLGFRRNLNVSKALGKWQKTYFGQTVLAGLAWGFGPAVLMQQTEQTQAALFVALLFAVCGVAINTLSAQRAALQAFVAAAMLPPALAAFLTYGVTDQMVAFALLLGAAMFMVVGLGTSRATKKLLATELRMRSILETALDSVIETDPQGLVTDWNLRAESMFGWSREEAIGQSLENLIIPERYRQAHRQSMTKIQTAGQQHFLNRRIEITAARRSGEEFPLELAITSIKIGNSWHFIAFAADITERKNHATALKDSEERFRDLTELSPEAILVHRDGILLYINTAAIKLFGASTADDLIGKQVLDLVHPDFRQTVLHQIKAYPADGSLAPVLEVVLLKFDGSPIQVEVQGRAMGFGGKPAYYSSMRDITESKKAAQAMRIAATAFESQQGMTITDDHSVILQVNKAFTDITGYSAQEAIGQTPRLLNSGRHDAAFYQAMWKAITEAGKWQGEIWNRHKSGQVFPEWLSITAVKNGANAVTHYVAAFSDISQHKKAESQIKNLAFYDPLTDLPNRRLLLDRLDQALTSSRRNKKVGALLFIDLDNFKNINDTMGHNKGDLLLQQVAQRLSACVRDADTVSRLGGDEFVLMLEELADNAPDAANSAEVVGLKILTSLGAPYQIGARECRTSPSIGVALFSDQLKSVDEILKRADLAMYQAKAAGRNTLRFFDPQMQAVVEANATLESDLREALALQQFCLHYQAQVTIDGRIVGAEALVRWQHPQKGLVMPAKFIAMAEQTGLILSMGLWVLEAACAQISDWSQKPELAELSVAVNVSAIQFRQTDFVDQILGILTRTGANPKRLKLELTESLLVDDVEDIITKMTTLKAMGVGFSLDDFGTGYSSLAYLSRLPLDQLKIDQSFVQDIESSDNAVAICAATISLAHSLKMKVVAEGVETKAQQYFLGTVHRCDLMQGYLFCRPVPVTEFERLASKLIIGSSKTET